MRRRAFITLLGGAAAAWPLSASGQPTSRTVKVGVLTSGNQFTSPAIASFRREMGNLGYVEGGNLTIEFRTAPGEPQRIVSQAAELVGMPVDVIVTDGTPAALAAKQATSNIPIVMAVIGVDPIQSGLVTSFARPDGNITGFAILAPELGTKRLEILKEAVPGLKRVGVLWNSTNPTNSTSQLAALAEAAGALGIEIQAVPVQNRDGFACLSLGCDSNHILAQFRPNREAGKFELIINGRSSHRAANAHRARPQGDRMRCSLLQCVSPVMALSGHARRFGRCPLSGAKRT
jgi:ABC-type uncharacterized transport system substrate-binding protein